MSRGSSDACRGRKHERKLRLTSQEVIPVLRLLDRHALVHGSLVACESKNVTSETSSGDKMELLYFTGAIIVITNKCTSIMKMSKSLCSLS